MFGALLGGPPQVDPQKQQEATQQWSAKLADPAMKAFLLNAGLQLMMPRQWGDNFASSLGRAAHAGATAAGGVQELEAQQARQDEARGRSEALRSQAREQQLADEERQHQRALELEGVRSEGRQKLVGMRGGGGDDAALQRAHTRIYTSALKDLASTREGRKLSPDQLQQEAMRQADEYVGRLRGGNVNAAPPTSPTPTAVGVPQGSLPGTRPGKTTSPISQETEAPMPAAGGVHPRNAPSTAKGATPALKPRSLSELPPATRQKYLMDEGFAASLDATMRARGFQLTP